MPPNIFATTGTNVSVVFIDKTNNDDKVVLMDASKLGRKIKIDGKNEKTVLSNEEQELIIKTFNNKEQKDNFSVVVSYDDIKNKNYSFSAGQYFDVKIEYIDITNDEFDKKIKVFKDNLKDCFKESKELEENILQNLTRLKYE